MILRKVLVTGGAGFIGSHLSRKLLKNSYKVTVYDNLSNGSGLKSLPKEIKVVKGDILNETKFKNACRNVEAVFHLAVKPLTMSFSKPEEVVKTNDYGTYLVAKTCVNLKLKLIHVSSSEAYGSALSLPMKESHPFFPSTIYASSKAASELYVRGFEKTNGLKMVIVRPFNCYGEYMRNDNYGAVFPKFINRILKKKPPIINGDGKQTRDFTYVDDICEGIMLADKNRNAIGDTFNIAQGKETSIKKIAEIMIQKYNEITGKDLVFKPIYKKSRPGDVKRHLADISHARRVLGYKPSISLEEGVKRLIEWNLNR